MQLITTWIFATWLAPWNFPWTLGEIDSDSAFVDRVEDRIAVIVARDGGGNGGEWQEHDVGVTELGADDVEGEADPGHVLRSMRSG